MATLREYFDTDFPQLNIAKAIDLMVSDLPPIQMDVRIHLDFNSNTKFISCFLPLFPTPLVAFAGALDNLSLLLSIADDFEIRGNLQGEQEISSTELRFSGRVFFYTESPVSDEEFESLRLQAVQNELYIQLRGSNFAVSRSAFEKPIAFISHDSRDQDEIARPIAEALIRLMCPVWYSEYSLRIGASLRESIEEGLKECKKCILILSPNFLNNGGWTKTEFNTILTREILEQKNLVLPIWFGVTRQQVYEYSPILVDRLGANWSSGKDEVVRKLHHAIIDPGL